MASSMFDLNGAVALVTGGNAGIGRGIALGLGAAGAAVAIAGRNAERNREVAAELEAIQVRAAAIQLDVSDRRQLEPALERVARELGPVDILVNNAGVAVVSPTMRLELADWDRVLETNLTACFILSRLVAQSMVERKAPGKIINVASEYAFFGSPGVPSYSASKGGLMQLTKSMAIELAPRSIQVNAIVPGWIETAMTEPVKSTPLYNEIILRTPAGRFGRPDECGGAAVFLASHASDFVTGTAIFVDGGYRIR